MIDKFSNNPWRQSERDRTEQKAHVISPVPLPPMDDHTITLNPKLFDEKDFIFLPLSNEILFPGLVYPIAIDNEAFYASLKRGLGTTPKQILHIVVGTPISDKEELYTFEEGDQKSNLAPYAVLCEVARLFDVGSDSNEPPALVLTAVERVLLKHVRYDDETYYCSIRKDASAHSIPRRTKEFNALVSTIHDLSVEFIQKSISDFPAGMLNNIRDNNTPEFIVHFACSMLPLKASVKYDLLSQTTLRERADKVLLFLQDALSMQILKNKIRAKTQEELDKQQKEYFLNQQIRMIQEELGTEESSSSDVDEFREKAKGKKWNDNVAATFEKELKKLEHLHIQSPDYAVQYQYLQTLIDLPWNEFTPDEFDLLKAEKILNRDHYGLEKVKERIIEYLAVLKLRNDMKAPILCLWGPPGVGKTSLGKSIAEALGRKYVRVSLGGLHDEAEIRGHRRTYIGSMPGRIIQSIKTAGSSNPVMVLDEIDKVSSDYKGDPESALLEVLDPEQNKAFHDNYVDIDFDLSNVFFVATANTLGNVSRPLLDRMELIEMSGYIEEEKIEIAKRHLIPKQLNEHGLPPKRLTFADNVLGFIIDGYTRESGVRMLDKQIAAICRKVALKIASNKANPRKKAITKKDVVEFIGPETFNNETYITQRYYGVVTGLAWTRVGGEILYIETSIHKGKDGQLVLTGNLGNVMKESATIALNYIRAHASELGLDEDFFTDKAIHIHVPEGAIPKDGPSAGITMVTSILSAVAKRYVKPRIAMTGEITLRGKVLPVGGVKEKILAAKRMGITDIILSEENKKDIIQIKELYLKGLTFHYVKDIREVLDFALEPQEDPKGKRSKRSKKSTSIDKDTRESASTKA